MGTSGLIEFYSIDNDLTTNASDSLSTVHQWDFKKMLKNSSLNVPRAAAKIRLLLPSWSIDAHLHGSLNYGILLVFKLNNTF